MTNKAPVRILCIDDEQMALELMEAQLPPRGYEVFTASSGIKALELMREVQPSIILLDIMMPGMDGLETLAEIKKIDPQAAVIMVTALADEKYAKKAVDLGAFDYIVKPINFDYLETAILLKYRMLKKRKVGDQ